MQKSKRKMETAIKSSSLEQREWIKQNDPTDWDFQEQFYRAFPGSTPNSFTNACHAVLGCSYQIWLHENMPQDTGKGIIDAQI